MQHQVLARKWRPKKFSDLIGQQQNVTILKNIIASGRLHHAYLLTGTRGVGKTTIARIIAKALNCTNLVASEPCLQCINCQEIDNGKFIDVIEIDAASNTGVDNIRELIDDAKYAPSAGKYKIYIIDEVHMLSKSAFNAMLKTLEEPPDHAIFILATTDFAKVPITIVSRCLQLKLRNLLPNEITKHLAHVLEKEQIVYEDGACELLGKEARGSMRDGLSLLDQAIAFSNNKIESKLVEEMLGISNTQIIFSLLNCIISKNGNELINIAKNIYAQGYSLSNTLTNLKEQLCQISIAQLTGNASSKELEQYTKALSVNDIHLYFEIAALGQSQLAVHDDKYPIFAMTLLRMLAFTIGSGNQKELLISTSNFTLTSLKSDDLPQNIAKDTESPSPNSYNTPSPSINYVSEQAPAKIRSPSIDQQISPQETLSSVATAAMTKHASSPQIDWCDIILTLKAPLGYLYPILENSTLVTVDNFVFEIIIDSRYQNIFNHDANSKLGAILTEHFKVQSTINFSFADSIDNTLKHKLLQEQEKRQQIAETAITNDRNLNTILEHFSATITPGSIKPN